MNTTELNTMNTQIQERIKQIEERGIECGQQSTYFGNEVYVHIYGNNERAAIYSPSQFLRWAEWYLNHHTEDDEYQDERVAPLPDRQQNSTQNIEFCERSDVSLGGTGIQII